MSSIPPMRRSRGNDLGSFGRRKKLDDGSKLE